jgi:hypothetical protein
METIAKSDLFFFISTISLVIISILLASLLVYGFRIVRDLRSLASKIREEGEEIVKDVKNTRLKFGEKSNNLTSLLSNFFARKTKRKKAHTEPKD